MKSKIIFLLSIVIFFISCNNTEETTDQSRTVVQTTEIQNPDLQKILDDALLDGTIIIYDKQKDVFHSNNFERANTGFLPASTFKIPNSIIALETGVMNDENTILKWNGEDHFMDIWEKDMSLKEAYQLSCVPCYQEIARNVGLDSMQKYLSQLNFGIMDVDFSNLDNFWLTGNSRISPLEQITFLRDLNNHQLPISKRTDDMMRSIMTLEDNENYHLRGKTGWSIDDNQNIGWFVAILDINGATYYLATNVEPKDAFDMNRFGMIRKSVSMKAFRILKMLP